MIQTVLAWMRLLRLPNHATAVADVLAGFLIVSRTPFGEWPADSLWLVIGASLCFYGGGMILNDVFDYRLDCMERPERPLPSGLISVALAGSVATVLLAAGLLLSIATAVLVQSPTPAIVGTSLLVAIVAYDFQLKQTSVGPIAMGICRSLNWLLGMSAVGSQERIEQWIAPLGMGIYVAGITWYSRREAGESRPKVLAALPPLCSWVWFLQEAFHGFRFSSDRPAGLWATARHPGICFGAFLSPRYWLVLFLELQIPLKQEFVLRFQMQSCQSSRLMPCLCWPHAAKAGQSSFCCCWRRPFRSVALCR